MVGRSPRANALRPMCCLRTCCTPVLPYTPAITLVSRICLWRMPPAGSDRGVRRPTPRIACFSSSLAIYSATKPQLPLPCNAEAQSHKIQGLWIQVVSLKENHVPPHRGKNYGCNRLSSAKGDDQRGLRENRRDTRRMDSHAHRHPGATHRGE